MPGAARPTQRPQPESQNQRSPPRERRLPVEEEGAFDRWYRSQPVLQKIRRRCWRMKRFIRSAVSRLPRRPAFRAEEARASAGRLTHLARRGALHLIMARSLPTAVGGYRPI